jgi:hypothetical protein
MKNNLENEEIKKFKKEILNKNRKKDILNFSKINPEI